MPPPSDLIRTILKRTREGKLAWGELSESGFMAPIGANSLIIDRMRSGACVLRITNERGTVIENITGDWNTEELEEIYESARRQALRVDETLVNIKEALEKL